MLNLCALLLGNLYFEKQDTAKRGMEERSRGLISNLDLILVILNLNILYRLPVKLVGEPHQ
jgi:hypothetical protein